MAGKKSSSVLKALQRMLGPTFDDIAASDTGRGVAAFGQQLKANPTGTVASMFDPVAGVKQSAVSLNEFRKDPNFNTAMTALADGIGGTPGLGATADVGGRFRAPSGARVSATVKNPQRIAYPGVYDRPDAIARVAAEKTAPESDLLKQLFGVTRDDLYEISKRKGNKPGTFPGQAANPKGSAAVASIKTPRNAQRLIDTISEGKRLAPDLFKGMHGWYVLDPMYHRMVELFGPEEGAKRFDRLNQFSGIESPNLPVDAEFHRATAANWLAEQGRFHDWEKYGGLLAPEKARMAPEDMRGINGRVGHVRASTSQRKVLEGGSHGMESPKGPVYIDASSVPDLGFQTDLPVGDAHFSRGVGLADTRTSKGFAESVSGAELSDLAPWYREKVTGPLGLEAVPGQAIPWGLFADATGVKTKVGAPKLELIAIEIGKTAKRLGISPEAARDLVLMGKTYAGRK